MGTRRVIAASANSKYFFHAQMLIASLNRTSPSVAEILFFDLGLTESERRQIAGMPRVRVVDYPAELRTFYPEFLTPNMFAWKLYALKEAGRLATNGAGGASLLYLDAGVAAINDVGEIFALIERDGVFLVGEPYSNADWTHEECFRIMQATPAERAARHVTAGVIGYVTGGPFQRVIDEAFAFAKIKACVFGDHRTHRHDQSILSVLVARHGVGPLREHGRLVHWEAVHTRDQVLFQHRGAFLPLAALGDRLAGLSGGRVALYGAGRHTVRHLPTLRHVIEPRHTVAGILDDAPSCETMGGLPVVRAEKWETLRPTLVVVSSDTHEAAMVAKMREMVGGRVEVWGIYARS